MKTHFFHVEFTKRLNLPTAMQTVQPLVGNQKYRSVSNSREDRFQRNHKKVKGLRIGKGLSLVCLMGLVTCWNVKIISSVNESTRIEQQHHFTKEGRNISDIDKSLQVHTQEGLGLVTRNETFIKGLCTTVQDPVCHHVIIVPQRKVSFCSGAKVASTTTRQYFFDITKDGSLVIPEDAKYGVHDANWTRIAFTDPTPREELLSSSEWTHVFFWKNVLERFVSGYLDKIKNDCTKPHRDTLPVLAHYREFGFSCEKHQDFEAFVSFMENMPVTKIEGHFSPQTPICNVKNFPFTDIIAADEHLSKNLEILSEKLGVSHPLEKKVTSSHRTGAKDKLIRFFKGKEALIYRILAIFEEDCKVLPQSCDVDDVIAALKD